MTDEFSTTSFKLPKKVIGILRSKPHQSEHISFLVLGYEEKTLVEKSVKEENREIDSEFKKIRNLNGTLDAWKKLKELGGDVSKLEQFLKGRVELPSPVKNDIQPKNEKTIGLDENDFCDFCKHKHANTEPKVCTNLYCNCGIRG